MLLFFVCVVQFWSSATIGVSDILHMRLFSWFLLAVSPAIKLVYDFGR